MSRLQNSGVGCGNFVFVLKWPAHVCSTCSCMFNDVRPYSKNYMVLWLNLKGWDKNTAIKTVVNHLNTGILKDSASSVSLYEENITKYYCYRWIFILPNKKNIYTVWYTHGPHAGLFPVINNIEFIYKTTICKNALVFTRFPQILFLMFPNSNLNLYEWVMLYYVLIFRDFHTQPSL